MSSSSKRQRHLGLCRLVLCVCLGQAAPPPEADRPWLSGNSFFGHISGFVVPPSASKRVPRLSQNQVDADEPIVAERRAPSAMGKILTSVNSPPAPLSTSAQYEQIMSKLSEDEKYNILLQSQSSKTTENVRQRGMAANRNAFQSLYKLVEEMSGKGVTMTIQSFASLMDAASLSRDMAIMQTSLIISRKNGRCRTYSRDVGSISPPSRFTALKELRPVPRDARTQELSAGAAAAVVLGGAFGDVTLGPAFDWDTTPGSLILLIACILGLFDFTRLKGQFAKLILAGLARLFTNDPEREARVQAATFMVAYLLGLPCFPYTPNVLEAVRLSEVDDLREVLKSRAGLHRLLTYLLAPVAAEEANHLQLIVSDPRQAQALIEVFRRKNPDLDLDGELSLRWAFREAQRMLEANNGLLERLRQRMESGGATVGDCVALLEGNRARGSGPDRRFRSREDREERNLGVGMEEQRLASQAPQSQAEGEVEFVYHATDRTDAKQ